MKKLQKYAARENSPFGDETADRVARVANEIIESGPLTRRAFVEHAKSRKSAAHKLFEWNLKKAAENHWLERAGELLGCVYEVNPATGKHARAYHNVVAVTTDGATLRSYQPLRTVMSDDAMLAQVSVDTYRSMLTDCDRIEAMGLDKDPAWRRIVSAVRSSLPLAAKAELADVGK